MLVIESKMMLPRGDVRQQSPLVIDLSNIYLSERRLEDVKTCNPSNCSELMGTMNIAANETSKYMSWIHYEILMAQKFLEKRKAILLLDEFPEYIKKHKDSGIKPSEDIREAFLMKDEEFYNIKDRVDCLTAALYTLESKLKTFVRAFNSAKTIAELRRGPATNPIMAPGKSPWEVMLNNRVEEDDNG